MTTPGKIIEYVEHGKFICAAVVADTGKRLRLLNQNGREVSLPQARVVHCTSQAFVNVSSRQETLAILAEISQTRQALELPVSLEEVWQLASESSPLSFPTRFLTELCFGELATDNHEAAFLRAIFKDRLYFKYKDGNIHAHSAEVVEQLLNQESERERKELLLKNGASSLALLMQDKDLPNWPDKEHCLELIKDYYLFEAEADDFETARSLLKESKLTAPHDPFHIMVKAGIWDKNENIALLRSKIPVEFPQECLEQAAELKELDGDNLCSQARRDFRELPLLTIDGPGTKDFDDALHIEKKGDNFLVGIHISDVSHYLKPGTPLYKASLERTTSLYFADGTVPMLPHDLSENIFSLVQGKDRPAVSFLVEISPEGAILSHKIVRSVVKVTRQLTYQGAEELYKQDGELHDLVKLSENLRKNRIESGALVIPIPDVAIQIENNDSVSIKLMDTETKMRVMVSEFMVLANSLGAEYLAVRQEPGLFRSQAPPQKRLFTMPQDDLYINFRQRRHLSRGILSTKAKRHSGVGVEQYTTMTSPIRRMLDLAMQIQLTEILQQKGSYYSTKDLNILSADLLAATSKANHVSQSRHRYWILKHLETHVNELRPAFILARNDKKVRIVLTDFLLEGELPPSQAVSAGPGDTIMVKIAKVQALDGVLRLEWG